MFVLCLESFKQQFDLFNDNERSLISHLFILTHHTHFANLLDSSIGQLTAIKTLEKGSFCRHKAVKFRERALAYYG